MNDISNIPAFLRRSNPKELAMTTTIPVEKAPESTEDELNSLAMQLTGAVLDIDAKVVALQTERRGGPAKSDSRLSEALQQWALESPRSREHEHETTPP